MYIKNLTLKNFRSYREEEFSFNDGINILTGSNAQGKTNAAEAIFFLCTGYSPRANRDKLVVNHQADSAEIKGVANSRYGDVSVRINFSKTEKKNVYINDIQILKIGEILGNINSVFFNPSELKLVQESPEDRRRFLNISISQMSKPYFYALQRYNKILSQRNNLLKSPDHTIIRETLPIWDEQLTRQAGKIIKARNDFLEEIAPFTEEKHAYLSDGKETLSIKTESGYTGSEEDIAYAMKEDLKLSLDRDMRLGFTSIGPHRDDIKFILNGEDARIFASQGQQRTVALSLKLAETETFYKRFKEYPILILDDVLSELDKHRQRKLVCAVSHLQTIFTAINMDRQVFKNKEFNRLIIKDSHVTKGK